MSMKVLIADPDWRFARQASNYLESHAHLVINNTNTSEILDCIRHWQPDLVILSAELAETGLLGSISKLSARPAILLTEHMDRYDRAWRIWQDGGDELLLKPIFKTKELQQSIVAALENATVGVRLKHAAATA